MVHTKTNGNAVTLFVTSLIDLFLPRTCASCNSNLPVNERFICTACMSKILRADAPLLRHEYSRKFLNKKIISDFTSLFIFEKDKELQNIIHSVKYRNKFLTAKYLGELSGKTLGAVILKWNIDIIIPVPLHRLKKAERGYNQSWYYAKGLSSVLGLPLLNNAVRRKKYTATQTLMTLGEREQNINGAFSIKKNRLIKGRNILLVDDVITTGATLNECGRVLKENGAANVYAISAAIAE